VLWIARVVPMKINEIEVCLDFHIFAIFESDLFIDHLVEKLFKEKYFHEGLGEKLGTTAFATHIPCLEIPMAKHNPNHNLVEEAKFISPFVSPRVSSETEHLSSPSLEPKPCPSDQHDISLKKQNFSTMDIPEATTLETKQESANEHAHFSFVTSHVP
jgi:hypothetical protein